MCGIVFHAHTHRHEHRHASLAREWRWDSLATLVRRRGPDYYSDPPVQWCLEPPNSTPKPQPFSPVSCVLLASVLHLRGTREVTQQPVLLKHNDQDHPSMLCFNGELYSSPSFKVDHGESDIHALFSAITSCHSAENQPLAKPNAFTLHLLSVLSRIRGEWAFLYYHAPTQTVYFGRDYLGRRSLLWHLPVQCLEGKEEEMTGQRSSTSAHREFMISSVGTTAFNDNESSLCHSEYQSTQRFWEEVPTEGIYSLELAMLGSKDFTPSKHIKLYPWKTKDSCGSKLDSDLCIPIPASTVLNRYLPEKDDLMIINAESTSSKTNLLRRSKKPLSTTTILTPSASSDENNATNTTITTIPASPPLLSPQLPSPLPTTTNASTLPDLDDLPAAYTSALDMLESLLSDAVKQRIEFHQVPIHNNSTTEATRTIAILFSGGLDCTVLAALAHRHLDESVKVDLINVGFENPRSATAAAKLRNKGSKKADIMSSDVTTITSPPTSSAFDVPDRLTGRKGAYELRRLFPGRDWRFVEVDVPYVEAVAERRRVLGLAAPSDSVMDLSIAIAFWFAARGRGTLTSEDESPIPFTTSARVLLSGLGADEQLGGYSRHRAKFVSSGWSGLLDELQLDVSRIGARNLGRDDRIIADLGREVRFPFLAEPLVDALSKLPVHLKTDPRLARGVGDKLLLRLLARRLGLERASVEAKRAVQFGARTAKMEDAKESGEMVVKLR